VVVPPGVAVICAGRTTARAAEEAGLRVDAIAPSPSSAAVAETVAAVLARR
jgi:uroporphyrinogen-III synthase